MHITGRSSVPGGQSFPPEPEPTFTQCPLAILAAKPRKGFHLMPGGHFFTPSLGTHRPPMMQRAFGGQVFFHSIPAGQRLGPPPEGLPKHRQAQPEPLRVMHLGQIIRWPGAQGFETPPAGTQRSLRVPAKITFWPFLQRLPGIGRQRLPPGERMNPTPQRSGGLSFLASSLILRICSRDNSPPKSGFVASASALKRPGNATRLSASNLRMVSP
jgi:hypothetical protein